MKIEVTDKYLNNILQALKEAKELLPTYKSKNSLNKHIISTKRYIEKGSKSNGKTC